MRYVAIPARVLRLITGAMLACGLAAGCTYRPTPEVRQLLSRLREIANLLDGDAVYATLQTLHLTAIRHAPERFDARVTGRLVADRSDYRLSESSPRYRIPPNAMLFLVVDRSHACITEEDLVSTLGAPDERGYAAPATDGGGSDYGALLVYRPLTATGPEMNVYFSRAVTKCVGAIAMESPPRRTLIPQYSPSR